MYVCTETLLPVFDQICGGRDGHAQYCHSLYMIPFEMCEAWGSIFYICGSQAVVNLLESDALFLIEPNRCIIDMEQVVFHIRLTKTQ